MLTGEWQRATSRPSTPPGTAAVLLAHQGLEHVHELLSSCKVSAPGSEEAAATAQCRLARVKPFTNLLLGSSHRRTDFQPSRARLWPLRQAPVSTRRVAHVTVRAISPKCGDSGANYMDLFVWLGYRTLEI